MPFRNRFNNGKAQAATGRGVRGAGGGDGVGAAKDMLYGVRRDAVAGVNHGYRKLVGINNAFYLQGDICVLRRILGRIVKEIVQYADDFLDVDGKLAV